MIDEKPVEFRLPRCHVEAYPTSGVLKVKHLHVVSDATRTVPGKLFLTLTRDELLKRPDFHQFLIKLLQAWQA